MTFSFRRKNRHREFFNRLDPKRTFRKLSLAPFTQKKQTPARRGLFKTEKTAQAVAFLLMMGRAKKLPTICANSIDSLRVMKDVYRD